MAYKGSVIRIERLSRLVLFLVMLTLAGFLSALGNKILHDMDLWNTAPDREAFQDKSALESARQEAEASRRANAEFEDDKSALEKSLQKAERQYQAEKQSYADWLEARRAIGSSQEDIEIRTRANTLDRYRRIQESWQARIDDFEKHQRTLTQQQSVADEKLRKLEQASERKYEKAMEYYYLKVFFIRLAFVLPILGLGLYLFLRFRTHRFWPLVWGFILFSLHAFFVGLLPYLPSFGGYIRLAVGAVLSLFIGYYVVKQLHAYLQKKKMELEESTKERASKIKDEIAVRAFQSHSCPSCERDFLIGKWYPKVGGPSEVRSSEEAPDHCAFCGLPLFGKCPKCGKRNFLHFPYCSACGSTLAVLKQK